MSLNVEQLWNNELILKHDLSGPRYTSYPTAPQFKEGFTQQQWMQAVKQSNASKAPLSLYFHIPYCNTVCYYCACNKIITANKKLAEPYVQALEKELALQARYIDSDRTVDQLHWGGGTPTYLSDEQMTLLMRKTAEHFNLRKDDSGEYSIEVHPGGVTPKRLEHIRSLGFNRLSMGVQDFDPAVQKAVNRFNSFDEVNILIKSAQQLGFESTSIDLIYGLPLQNQASFAKTLDKVLEIQPNRLSVFNYAHMPDLFKTQKQIDASQLPAPHEKLSMLYNSIERLLDAGYVYVGMDHFALPDDELAIAQKEGILHRNFQGYATHGSCDLFAFGISSIASFGDVFIQNHKDTDEYYACLEKDLLPLYKGFKINNDDKIRQAVISELICHFKVDFAVIENRFAINFNQYFEAELTALLHLQNDGLLDVNEQSINVHNVGRLLIRRICMVFDAYLNNAKNATDKGPKYSRII
ncbi:oxygen-independent coproporphyrinogen-3 oxidase [Alteromonadaceae bacterium Bs31]|nr:oxygen-independent coproporphyrinogen-3 oxidase [Alteromonadaceae bacterium Bs31]